MHIQAGFLHTSTFRVFNKGEGGDVTLKSIDNLIFLWKTAKIIFKCVITWQEGTFKSQRVYRHLIHFHSSQDAGATTHIYHFGYAVSSNTITVIYHMCQNFKVSARSGGEPLFDSA